MAVIVQKYGGSSVAGVQKLREVAAPSLTPAAGL
jgi:aspartokinase